ncbi:Retrovirus-related Pol polyprotein from transposon TNT 1-94 [Sesamum angolense]|uniref:Retrovirus-related Pol polyprotein from transposon TNT 1-94 n=1 Tax=Sesamum angolense TaxID=2727404 RepID=A0AAE1XD16_9LAMI|nr:Retrovirus-related Pol polyprotein from transposon TNT 1-94 [Sesamum angolense]
MVEDRSVAEQTHEIINLEHALADAEMKLLENFLAISGRTISIGNSSTTEVLGIGSVDLKLSLGLILTWVLVDLLSGCTTIRCKWIFKKKLKPGGIVDKFKARLMDVKTSFLYSELEEEIYMDQHEGFVAHGNKCKVCKPVKSLYGLKQAPKQWHEKFDKTILAFGFTGTEVPEEHGVTGYIMVDSLMYLTDIVMLAG